MSSLSYAIYVYTLEFVTQKRGYGPIQCADDVHTSLFSQLTSLLIHFTNLENARRLSNER